MLEGVYFQFPKLGFLLFFFLACEALCPLRANPLYFPRTPMFAEVGVKSPLWLWISKWAMITLFIVALMSPVREREMAADTGYDILLVIDPAALTSDVARNVHSFVERRPMDRIALWVPAKSEVIVPLTRDHDALRSILSQLTLESNEGKVTRQISRFFTTSHEDRRWALILSETPETFVYSLPVDVETSVIDVTHEKEWPQTSDRDHPPYSVVTERKYFDYYYVYPLFLGFLAMLAYLYGRNQKGVK
ncbi:MAG: hypothetical protein JXK04_08280 [Campylobacterales bacterium]|nr:hypothetical protein [Campylobacterales bacterium]